MDEKEREKNRKEILKEFFSKPRSSSETETVLKYLKEEEKKTGAV